jgi:NADPH:quinone reductase-like Zn-dependent oxidoreductase
MTTQHSDRTGPAPMTDPASAPAPTAARAGGGPVPPTMRAMVQDRYGEAEDVLHPAEVETPTPREGEVLVRVGAAGVDRGVWHLVAGRPNLVRLGTGLRAPRQRTPGMDLAGRVVAIGPGVTRLRVGDDVLGVGVGTFAGYARAREDRLVLRPAGLGVVEAAVLPVSGCTALQAVRDHGRVRAGDRVLVIGASGGVGTFAVAIAAARGAEVTGVCSTGKVDLVRSLGAHHVVDRSVEEVTDSGERYDVVLDIGGGRPLGRLRRVLAPRGTLVIVGAETGGPWLGGLDRQLRAAALSPFVRQRLGTFVATTRTADLETLVGLVGSGAVRPAVDRTFPLADAPAALRYLLDGRAAGKVALVP